MLPLLAGQCRSPAGLPAARRATRSDTPVGTLCGTRATGRARGDARAILNPALALEGALCDNVGTHLPYHLPQLASLAAACVFSGQSDVQPLLSDQGYACPLPGWPAR